MHSQFLYLREWSDGSQSNLCLSHFPILHQFSIAACFTSVLMTVAYFPVHGQLYRSVVDGCQLP